MQWFGDPDLPLAPTSVDDVVATLAAAGTRDTSDEGSGTCRTPPRPAAGRRLRRRAGRRVLRLVSRGSARIRLLGRVLPLARDLAGMAYQFEQPVVVDGSRAAHAFGLTPTPYEVGARRTLEALRG